MARKRKGCKFCDADRKDWGDVTFPVDVGEFGEYEILVWVSGYSRRLGIAFGEKHREPILEKYLSINYCPFCGTKLPLKEDGE